MAASRGAAAAAAVFDMTQKDDDTEEVIDITSCDEE
jgi:hypothetical protein